MKPQAYKEARFEANFDTLAFKYHHDSGMNMSSQTEETTASTFMSESDSRPSESSSKNKKEKKQKDKRRSSRSTKSSKSSNTNSDSSDGASDYSQQLFAKMLQDAYGDSLGDFGAFDNDPFESEVFDEDDWGDKNNELTMGNTNVSKSGSRNSASSGGSSPSPRSGVIVGNSKPKKEMVLDVDVNNLLTQREEGPPGANDSLSVLSDLTGLTGVFQGIPQRYARPDDEKEDPNLPIIMEHLLRENPLEQKESVAATPYENKLKGCLSLNTRVPPRSGSIHSRTSSQVSSTATPKKSDDKNLCFSTVSIRHYERILTLNPSTIQGPSIGIGWRYQATSVVDLDLYEAQRGPPRPSPQLVLNRTQREELLASVGVSSSDIAAGVRDNLKARDQRRRTVQGMNTFGQLKKVLNFGGKK